MKIVPDTSNSGTARADKPSQSKALTSTLTRRFDSALANARDDGAANETHDHRAHEASNVTHDRVDPMTTASRAPRTTATRPGAKNVMHAGSPALAASRKLDTALGPDHDVDNDDFELCTETRVEEPLGAPLFSANGWAVPSATNVHAESARATSVGSVRDRSAFSIVTGRLTATAEAIATMFAKSVGEQHEAARAAQPAAVGAALPSVGIASTAQSMATLCRLPDGSAMRIECEVLTGVLAGARLCVDPGRPGQSPVAVRITLPQRLRQADGVSRQALARWADAHGDYDITIDVVRPPSDAQAQSEY